MNPSPIRLRPPNPESGTYDSLLLRICPSKARAPESCSLGFKSGQIGIRETRNVESWKRHFMRVGEDGKFVGQWLFDHAILTTFKINGKDIAYGGLDGPDLSAAVNQSFEYELRGGGQYPLENWIAHRYLAIAQSSGAALFPQVFFVGPDFFDGMGAGSQQAGDKWKAYTDLTNYLGGLVGWVWVGPQLGIRDSLRTIRLRTSFHPRTKEELDSSTRSVVTPTANLNITVGMNLVIELHRETSTTPWPSIMQMIAAKYEPPYLANPLFEDASTSSASVVEGPYPDSAPTHEQYVPGKLTDGKVAEGGT
ncbi:hypothetical protein Fcan01_25516 [Folsomia candida]|uniref:Uncharacterized protein n=1 Tax=Folsomia candida TaxID=158441 RepID=A0A226D3V1_FOLCA|nr:hypothetical protein Fcan01_25516 [Folsomia candida]